MGRKNSYLNEARVAKKDEFYTQYKDIDKEIKHYKEQLNGKVVYLPCDDPKMSEFWSYFVDNFEYYGLKQLVSTYYRLEEGQKIYATYYDGEKIERVELEGDGDFRSDECLEILKKCDIVITNPPFSLWREFIAWILENDKDCLIVSNNTCPSNKVGFKYFKAGRIWGGFNTLTDFIVPAEYIDNTKYYKVDENGRHHLQVTARWITTLPTGKVSDLKLVRKYQPECYPKYENIDAIEVSKVNDIPVDYDGLMGVPITYIYKHDPEQFEIIGETRSDARVNGKTKFKRMFIKRREK